MVEKVAPVLKTGVFEDEPVNLPGLEIPGRSPE